MDNVKITFIEQVNEVWVSTAVSNLNTAFADVTTCIEVGATVPVITRAERAAALTHAALLLVDSLIREASELYGNFLRTNLPHLTTCRAGATAWNADKAQHDVLAVAADVEKEDLLLAALPHIKGTLKVIVAGYGHLEFRDELFHEELSQLLVPSLANGYPNTLTHLHQRLANAARLSINGVVAEFGMLKGGTTMFSRA